MTYKLYAEWVQGLEKETLVKEVETLSMKVVDSKTARAKAAWKAMQDLATQELQRRVMG
jgi:hypothetical protein